jgi:hypothetical protein
MNNQEYKNRVEYGVSLVVLLVGIFFIFQAFTIETSREVVGPRTMPLSLAVFLVLGGLWLAIRAFLGRAGDLSESYGFLESNLARIFMVIGCGAIYVFTFWAFGYFLAIIATYILMLLTFGVRNWVSMVLGGIVLAVIFQWLFMGIMMLNDPKGALINLRPYTSWISEA